jgi:hypothetical protein
MDIPTPEEFLAKVEDFCRRHDMAETRFGRDAINNPNFIAGLRRDPPVSPTLETLNRIAEFMAGKDAELKRNPPPLELTPPPQEEEIPLPFGTAPVNPTGASSPTSSPTIEPPATPAANASCRSSCNPEEKAPTEARAA